MVCAGGMKDVRQQFDWPAGLIDRVSSLMRCKKKNYRKGFCSLQEWELKWIPTPGPKLRGTDGKSERDRKGLRETWWKPRGKRRGGVSCTYPQTCWKRACEESI